MQRARIDLPLHVVLVEELLTVLRRLLVRTTRARAAAAAIPRVAGPLTRLLARDAGGAGARARRRRVHL